MPSPKFLPRAIAEIKRDLARVKRDLARDKRNLAGAQQTLAIDLAVLEDARQLLAHAKSPHLRSAVRDLIRDYADDVRHSRMEVTDYREDVKSDEADLADALDDLKVGTK